MLRRCTGLRGRLAAAALALTPTWGCSRSFWRQQADKDSYQAITEHITDPRWAIPRFDVTPDPRSRFYDPYDPDKAPLPPDDPAAHVYMHWVDGWEGYKGWHKFGDLMSVENPQWLANFGISTEMMDPLTGEYLGPIPALTDVTLEDAVELAQIHNRQYQTIIENVYLAALAVTFQRFQFGVRYLGIGRGEPAAFIDGNIVPNAPNNITGGFSAGVSQLLPAGTQWAVELANNTIWLFGTGGETRTMSSLSYSIVQPLLLGAGRKVGLENLTLVERRLLYQTRTLARFRKELFTDVVGGAYLGLLQQVQAIRNQRDNIVRTEEQLEQLMSAVARNLRFAGVDLEQWPADVEIDPALGGPAELGGKLLYREDLRRMLWSSQTPITDREIEILRNLSDDPGFQAGVLEIEQSLRREGATLDVLQLQSELTGAVNRLRDLERALQDGLDALKILLGLPPDMVLTIDDGLLQPFEIIDPQLQATEELVKDFVDAWGALDDDNPEPEQMRDVASRFQSLIEMVERDALTIVEEDARRVNAIRDRRLQELDTDLDRRTLVSDLNRANFLLEEVTKDFQVIRRSAAEVVAELNLNPADAEARSLIRTKLGLLREELLRLVQNLTVVQVSLRVELIEIQPFELALQEAVQLGLDNRMDLMNARAAVMDARRTVEVAANALRGAMDVVVEGGISTPPGGNNPVDFRGDQHRMRAGLRVQAPLDQIAERNAYRAALIEYQRTRRDYMQAEDQVKLQIRQAWRLMFVQRRNLETSRRAVRIAALQFDAAVNEARDPAAVGRGGGLQGQNLLRALDGIVRAQDQLIQNWISYERNRLNIYRDMDIMEIGPDGLWNDPFYRKQAHDEFDFAPEIRQLDDLGAHPGAGVGRSRVGGGLVQAAVVELADRLERPEGEHDHHRDGHPRAVPDQPVRAGAP